MSNLQRFRETHNQIIQIKKLSLRINIYSLKLKRKQNKKKWCFKRTFIGPVSKGQTSRNIFDAQIQQAAQHADGGT